MATYRRLQESSPDAYDFDGDRFSDAVWPAIYVNRPEVVLPLIRVWIELFPESASAHEMLGRARMAAGDRAAAAESARRAAQLDPPSETVADLIRQLERG